MTELDLRSLQPKLASLRRTNIRSLARKLTPKKPVVKDDKPIGTAAVTCSALNVRADAILSAARIGGLVKGQSFSYYAVSNGWLKIAYGAGFGWVNAQYTSYKAPDTPTTPTTPETPAFTQFDVTVTASDGLNVRTGPGADNTKIGALENGKIVTVIGEQNGWYQINYNGTTGWICAEYTTKNSGSVTQPQEPESKQVVTTDALNLRDIPGSGSTPGSGSSILLTIPAGTVLTVTEEQNGWYKVSYNGKTGWCCAEFTASYDPSASTGKGQDAVALASKYIGKKTKDLLGTLPYLQDLSDYSGTNNGYDLNCANFVTAILQQVGLLKGHSINVSGVRTLCLNEGYHKSSKAAAKPGDIWLNGHHTELVYSNSGSSVTLIGSNNKGDVQYVGTDAWSGNQSNSEFYSCQ